MGGLEVAQAAVLDERDAPPRELELEQVGVVPRAHEHRLLAQLHALLARGQHAVADLAASCASSRQNDQRRARRRPRARRAALREARASCAGDGVGGVEQRLGRAVVALERDRRRVRRSAPGSRGCGRAEAERKP